MGALVAFFLIATPTMHDFWAIDDPEQVQHEMIHFLKNFALLGVSLAFLVLADESVPSALELAMEDPADSNIVFTRKRQPTTRQCQTTHRTSAETIHRTPARTTHATAGPGFGVDENEPGSTHVDPPTEGSR